MEAAGELEVNLKLRTDDPLAPAEPANRSWTRHDAAHLLRRTGFGATVTEIDRAVDEGLEATLQRRLAPQPESEEFDQVARLLRNTAHQTGSIGDLKAWWFYRMRYTANSLVERMALLWHDHFATSYGKVQSVKQMAAQNDAFRRHALGDFRELLHEMSRDVAMLVWLDGNANRKRHPNENFAREVMELFSLGIGNYTEADIIEAARAFSGWHVRKGEFWFNELQHDTGEKTVFGRTGNLNGDDVIELCLEQPACPRFIAVKLLRYFVQPEPQEELIAALADRIQAHNFQITPVLGELFRSRAFWAESSRLALIKSPVDLVVGSQRSLEVRSNLNASAEALEKLGQDLFQPPTVKGWDGGRDWISTTTMILRINFATELAGGERFGEMPHPAALARQLGAGSREEVVTQIAAFLLGREPATEETHELAAAYQQAGGDRTARIRSLLQIVLSTPDYQLT
ncbi:MAG: DUF1800 domain-containing protein [Planctomycetota bacterium]|nr:MAG: DUF1800 domain-containing protein [Planctomycetota bacterium]REK21022.1 MAG: DUF1800 domain-containing protein [Planctomycetota bacterium]REK38840.1 MAG: DUF1800 domain-containing protein [Planctomycetota bacterium]